MNWHMRKKGCKAETLCLLMLPYNAKNITSKKEQVTCPICLFTMEENEKRRKK